MKERKKEKVCTIYWNILDAYVYGREKKNQNCTAGHALSTLHIQYCTTPRLLLFFFALVASWFAFNIYNNFLLPISHFYCAFRVLLAAWIYVYMQVDHVIFIYIYFSFNCLLCTCATQTIKSNDLNIKKKWKEKKNCHDVSSHLKFSFFVVALLTLISVAS